MSKTETQIPNQTKTETTNPFASFSLIRMAMWTCSRSSPSRR